ncbi:hypothetical protein [Clostridium sp. VAP52]|uniref:hypothetical protein n=1 Tax=Clostridium sp. VAP52 TaxID=2949977 RepID=UPI002079FC0B|nr:hypothetical protein [Clostridium sp. VAP52]
MHYSLDYPYEKYMEELQNEEKLKKQMFEFIEQSKLTFLKKRKAVKLANKLNNTKFF